MAAYRRKGAYDAGMLTTVLTIILGGSVGALLVWHVHQSSTVKRRHLHKIQERVLPHLREQLDSYLPILRYEEGLVYKHVEPTFASRPSPSHGTSDYHVYFRIKDPALAPGETSGPPSLTQPPQDPAFAYFYADTREHHFPHLCQQWEWLHHAMGMLGRNTCKFVERLAMKLETQLQLPSAPTWCRPAVWVDYHRLAIATYERLWGVRGLQLRCTEDMGEWQLAADVITVGRGPHVEMSGCIAVVEEVAATETGTMQRLHDLAARITPRAESLRHDLEHALLQRYLPGQCAHTNVNPLWEVARSWPLPWFR